MCLAVPGEVVQIQGNKAEIDFGGIRRTADISLLDIKKGDFVLVHAGFAIAKVDAEEAKKTLVLWEEVLENKKDLDNIV
ncbi:MAG: HypC/HybG/HupF family hydrogenase formation chaperone [Thermoplasmata archaeon]